MPLLKLQEPERPEKDSQSYLMKSETLLLILNTELPNQVIKRFGLVRQRSGNSSASFRSIGIGLDNFGNASDLMDKATGYAAEADTKMEQLIIATKNIEQSSAQIGSASFRSIGIGLDNFGNFFHSIFYRRNHFRLLPAYK